MKTNPLIKIVSIASLLLSGFAQAGLNDLAILPLAPATDWKGYAGVNCMPANESADYYRSVISGSYANMGDTAVTVVCPVVRDVSTGGDGRILRARVRLTDANPTADGYCRFHSRTIQGNAFNIQQQAWVGDGQKTITFESVDASNWGSYFISCRIPGSYENKKSFIRSYSVDEVS